VVLASDDPFCPACGRYVGPEDEETPERRSPLDTMAFVGRSLKLLVVLSGLLVVTNAIADATIVAAIRGEHAQAALGGVLLLGCAMCIHALWKMFLWARRQS
jgi:hypothetical protein